MSPHYQAQLPSLPEDLITPLRAMDSRSYEFGRDLRVLNELAGETGHATLTLEQVFPPHEVPPPDGFTSELIVPNGVELPLRQFDGTIHSLAYNGDKLELEVHRLVTDSRFPINYCDLRPYMSNAVRKGGPSQASQAVALDRAFLRDIKFFAELGHSRNHVTDVRGVCYTKLSGTKIRAFWMPVNSESGTGAPLVARLADCGDSVASEANLHRRVFGRAL